MRQIAIYGKAGIGKSTTTQNTVAAIAELGKQVLLLGCDPKADCTRLLMHGKAQSTVRDVIQKFGPGCLPEMICSTGFGGVTCVEAGGPELGVGCDGRGITTSVQTLSEMGIYEDDLDFVFYDVPGDVACGDFTMPIREGYVQEIYLEVSGEYTALCAANNLCKLIKKFAEHGPVRLGGIICNSRVCNNEEFIVSQFAKQVNSKLIRYIPRDNIVHFAEIKAKTVIEYDTYSVQAEVYRNLARKIIYNDAFTVPTPLSAEELEDLMKRYGLPD
jgi:nitrogenase iron protein NifH